MSAENPAQACHMWNLQGAFKDLHQNVG